MSIGQQESLPFADDEPLSAIELGRPLVFFDLETTGLDLQMDRIVQFAFLRINLDRSQDEWKEMINPGIPIPPEAARVHHITDEMVADKPFLKDFAPLIRDFLADCDLSGFNIIRFDIPFLQAEMKRNGYPLDLKGMKIVDAQVIYHKNEPRDLTAAYRFYCGGDHVEAHDAMGDVRVTLQILDAQLKKYKLSKTLAGLHAYCMPRPDHRFVTSDKKFAWKNDQAVLTFGKHKGKSLPYLVEHERDYLIWMQNGDFAEETKNLIADALNGIFPRRESDNAESND
ncbi:3'-5' exonuclease [candidate division KSB1 bacterium]|nr:3'-5' exonuclease [candidate division KSB1 bacterium]